MSVSIEFEYERQYSFNVKETIEKVILQALDYVSCPYECSINVLLTNDDSIHEMNREYRDTDRATDVLSFPMLEYDTPADFSFVEDDPESYADPDSGELVLGDIVISLERMEAQAKEYNHSLRRELAFLVAHSMLHLCGYDHMEEGEREIMEQKQEEILRQLGITRDAE